jgi:hypothetical protein
MLGPRVGRCVAAALTWAAMAATALPALAQPTTAPKGQEGRGPTSDPADASKLAGRRVSGTVKTVANDGLVVVGRERGGPDREWVFVLEPTTKIGRAGATAAASELRVGDPVTVVYAERGGKVVAQSVILERPGAQGASPAAPAGTTKPAAPPTGTR